MDTQNSDYTPGSGSPSESPNGYSPVHGTEPGYGGQQYPPQPGTYPPAYQQQPYQQPPYGQPYGQPGMYPPAPAQGLSDNAAGALAYVTIIPAIIFLVIEPYNQRPFVKFNAFQCLFMAGVGFVAGLVAVIPLIGWIVWILTSLTLLVMWVLCIVNASQGKVFRIPVLGDLAAQQAGLR